MDLSKKYEDDPTPVAHLTNMDVQSHVQKVRNEFAYPFPNTTVPSLKFDSDC